MPLQSSRDLHRAEPSIPTWLIAAVRVVGVRRLMKPPVRARLALSGLTWEQIEPALAGVRRIADWAAAFESAAATAESRGNFADASAYAYLGQLPLSPYNPSKPALRERFCRNHVAHRASRPGIRFERLTLARGGIVAYKETPVAKGSINRPTILLLPPLASTKEELTLLADPFLEAGYTVVRMDLPGQGESTAALRADAELVIAEALYDSEAPGEAGVVAGGISLGAHFALRLAAREPKRVRAAFAISPMAIRTEREWKSLPEIIYQYLDIYFQSTRFETHSLARQLQLEPEIADSIRCPVYLFHAAADSLALPTAPAVYRELLSKAALTERIVRDRHGCLLHLNEFGTQLGAWCEELAVIPRNIETAK